METAIQLPLYGYLHFDPCLCDYPMTYTPAQVIIGNRELIMKIRNQRGETKEGSFKVVRFTKPSYSFLTAYCIFGQKLSSSKH